MLDRHRVMVIVTIVTVAPIVVLVPALLMLIIVVVIVKRILSFIKRFKPIALRLFPLLLLLR